MKHTGIKVTEVSIETMLNDKENSAYNPSVWAQRVKDFAKYKNVKFYIRPKDEIFSYDKFFVSYTIEEGLNFLSEWSAFHSSITNNGFKRACIIDGEIVTSGFGKDGEECIKNSREGRKWLVDNICKYGVMVTNSL